MTSPEPLDPALQRAEAFLREIGFVGITVKQRIIGFNRHAANLVEFAKREAVFVAARQEAADAEFRRLFPQEKETTS